MPQTYSMNKYPTRESLPPGVYTERVHNETTTIPGEGRTWQRWGNSVSDSADTVGVPAAEFDRWVFETHNERTFFVW